MANPKSPEAAREIGSASRPDIEPALLLYLSLTTDLGSRATPQYSNLREQSLHAIAAELLLLPEEQAALAVALSNFQQERLINWDDD